MDHPVLVCPTWLCHFSMGHVMCWLGPPVRHIDRAAVPHVPLNLDHQHWLCLASWLCPTPPCATVWPLLVVSVRPTQCTTPPSAGTSVQLGKCWSHPQSNDHGTNALHLTQILSCRAAAQPLCYLPSAAQTMPTCATTPAHTCAPNWHSYSRRGVPWRAVTAGVPNAAAGVAVRGNGDVFTVDAGLCTVS